MIILLKVRTLILTGIQFECEYRYELLKVMSFSERRYIDQLIHLFAVPQYLGLIAWPLSIHQQTTNPKYGAWCCSNIYIALKKMT
jgi:hypothetical protein